MLLTKVIFVDGFVIVIVIVMVSVVIIISLVIVKGASLKIINNYWH